MKDPIQTLKKLEEDLDQLEGFDSNEVNEEVIRVILDTVYAIDSNIVPQLRMRLDKVSNEREYEQACDWFVDVLARSFSR